MQQNKEILIKANNAIKNGDHEGFLAFCTDDTEWKFIGDLTLKGKDAVRQWMAENYIEPPKFDVKYLIEENDFVTAVGEVSMTDKDGRATHYSYSDVWRFRNGKMAELSAFVIENK